MIKRLRNEAVRIVDRARVEKERFINALQEHDDFTGVLGTATEVAVQVHQARYIEMMLRYDPQTAEDWVRELRRLRAESMDHLCEFRYIARTTAYETASTLAESRGDVRLIEWCNVWIERLTAEEA